MRDGTTALMLCAETGCVDAIPLLAEAGEARVCDRQGLTALFRAAVLGRDTSVSALLGYEATVVCQGVTVLHAVAFGGSVEGLRLVTDYAASHHMARETEGPGGGGAETPASVLSTTDPAGLTPLHYTLGAVSDLLGMPYRYDPVRTPLCVEYLAPHYASTIAVPPAPVQHDPTLHGASEAEGHTPTTRMLAETPLSVAVRQGQIETITPLTTYPTPLHPSSAFLSPLHLAARMGLPPSALALLMPHAPPMGTAPGEYGCGRTPLHDVCMCDRVLPENVAVLRSYAGQLDGHGRSALMLLVRGQDPNPSTQPLTWVDHRRERGCPGPMLVDDAAERQDVLRHVRRAMQTVQLSVAEQGQLRGDKAERVYQETGKTGEAELAATLKDRPSLEVSTYAVSELAKDRTTLLELSGTEEDSDLSLSMLPPMSSFGDEAEDTPARPDAPHISAARLLLSDEMGIQSPDGLCALHVAVVQNDVPMCRLLASEYHLELEGRTALYLCCLLNRLECLGVLVDLDLRMQPDGTFRQADTQNTATSRPMVNGGYRLGELREALFVAQSQLFYGCAGIVADMVERYVIHERSMSRSFA
ncbi:hypothetical protein KIPB_001966 [Kipferlia bialata]|uniref:Uncharacterized protein n=1 Tax=Kipferlia bialata TaxID=797122 RepID=A0A391NPF4_9EUKA|nr:hypothetical protein KIPB_001966 [Kipferlia bialata]|eukprot:g1966.t1